MEQRGKLVLNFIGASDLLAKDLNGFSDPYVKWEIGEVEYKTSVVTKNLNPTWNETYVFDLTVEEAMKEITFSVIDYDSVGSHDFIGQITIPIAKGYYEDVHVLVDKASKKKKKEKKRGNLHMSVEFITLDHVGQLVNEPSFVIARSIARTFVSEEVSEAFMALGNLELWNYLVRDEIANTSDYATLFRTDSVATKMMRQYVVVLGSNWLKELVCDFVLEINANPTNFEVNPLKAGENDDISQNVNNVMTKVRLILDRVLQNLDTCPNDIRKICNILKVEVENKFENSHAALAGFVFLRFICPSMIAPDKIVGELNPISGNARKYLTLVGKIVQNIANGLTFQKEEFMIPFNALVEEYIPLIQNYLQDLATNESSSNPINGDDIPDYAIVACGEKLARELKNHKEQVNTNVQKLLEEENIQDWQSSNLEALFHIVDILEAEENQDGYQSKPKMSLFH